MPYPTTSPTTPGAIPGLTAERSGPRRIVLPATNATADSDGIAIVRYQVPQGTTWLLEALTARAYTASTTAVTEMYVGDVADTQLVDALTAALAIGEYNPPRSVVDSLVIRWTNLDPGDKTVASRVQVLQLRGL